MGILAQAFVIYHHHNEGANWIALELKEADSIRSARLAIIVFCPCRPDGVYLEA
jgi:hypothetical protein